VKLKYFHTKFFIQFSSNFLFRSVGSLFVKRVTFTTTVTVTFRAEQRSVTLSAVWLTFVLGVTSGDQNFIAWWIGASQAVCVPFFAHRLLAFGEVNGFIALWTVRHDYWFD